MNLTAAAKFSTSRLVAVADYLCDDVTHPAVLNLPVGSYRAEREGYVVYVVTPGNTKVRQPGNLLVKTSEGIRGHQSGTVTVGQDGEVTFTAR